MPAIKDFFTKYDFTEKETEEAADLVKFTEEIFYGKLKSSSRGVIQLLIQLRGALLWKWFIYIKAAKSPWRGTLRSLNLTLLLSLSVLQKWRVESSNEVPGVSKSRLLFFDWQFSALNARLNYQVRVLISYELSS